MCLCSFMGVFYANNAKNEREDKGVKQNSKVLFFVHDKAEKCFF